MEAPLFPRMPLQGCGWVFREKGKTPLGPCTSPPMRRFIESTFVVCELPICELAYSLKWVRNANPCSPRPVDSCRRAQSHTHRGAGAEIPHGGRISSQSVNKSFLFFTICLVTCFLHFSLPILLFTTAPDCSAGVLSRVPKCKKAVTCLVGKIHALDELRSGRVSVIGREFNVNEATIATK